MLMLRKFIFISALFLGAQSLSGCQTALPTSATLSPVEGAAQARLVGPLAQALDHALLRAEQSRSPAEAERLARDSFQTELSRLLKRSSTQIQSQLQVQAQWTAQGKIQLQLQAQISDQVITAQAQRQSHFFPAV
ncbi:MAG: hypothetical protein AB7I41_06905 [Candidatus Sericytochromatia bacterium]